jgi:hypothetical protein
MNKKQLLTYGLIALGLFLFTRKKEEDIDTSDNSDTVLPGSDTPATPVKPTPADPIVANKPAPVDVVKPTNQL